MRDPELVLEIMEARKEIDTYHQEIDDPAFQIEATLILAEQVKRIADLLESVTDAEGHVIGTFEVNR